MGAYPLTQRPVVQGPTEPQTTDAAPFYMERMLIELTENQERIWLDRYNLRDESGQPTEKDISDTWWRVANAIGRHEYEQTEFYGLLKDFKFLPGGRILAGAGAESEKTFYNCYVIPIEPNAANAENGNDSREAIFDTIGRMVGIMSRGGGVGINWSVLRPSGSYLARVSGSSSGPVGWMDVASVAVGEVEQGGSRRGAAMFMLDDWHPDVLKFIDAKRQKGKITNANISVAVSDRFMEALEKDADWSFVFPDTTDPSYNTEWDGDIDKWIEAGKPVRNFGNLPAVDIWESIAESAHASGEPGVVFLDRYNKLSTGSHLEKIISVNPCGEQGLGAYSVCNLGAMNLYAYTKVIPNGSPDHIGFDWPAFRRDVRLAVRFLDSVIDKSPSFLPQTDERQKQLRRIGLGVMGLADALVALKIRYGSTEAVDFVSGVFQTMKDQALEESAQLAFSKGKAGGWDDSLWERPYLSSWLSVSGRVAPTHGLRNLFLLTQAPTGTTSIFAEVNSGIEPYFALRTFRQDRTGGHWYSPKAISGLDLDNLPDYVVTSGDVTVEEHIAMQAAVQKWVDSSVSKTINAPKEQTVSEVDKAFRLAFTSGLKGVAYYRDGSRSEQVLYKEDPNEVIARLEARIAELENRDPFPIQWWHDRNFSGGLVANGIQTSDNMLYFDYAPNTCCGSPSLVKEEGCTKCMSCGWAACG